MELYVSLRRSGWRPLDRGGWVDDLSISRSEDPLIFFAGELRGWS